MFILNLGTKIVFFAQRLLPRLQLAVNCFERAGFFEVGRGGVQLFGQSVCFFRIEWCGLPWGLRFFGSFQIFFTPLKP
ncbi:hypothetical protein C7N43_35130 [Sphingobacteriales bacterium UPWRP_1]|nr:hypothetical protein BVG80_00765 [Sphingobacteriales bacterium TSM_CSM]PSJ72263.1 hypothetical protein C7N43_35130 [Sphingobacteriales bacterium UPWRP_1]